MIDIEKSVEAMGRQNAEGIVKIREDLLRYRDIIDRYQPDLVIETGTWNGKSAAWFARATGAPVITIDIHPVTEYSDEAPGWVGLPITQIVGSSTDPDVVARVRCRARQRPLLILDSDHTGAHVLAEMEAYHDLVPVGGYMVVEDGILAYNTAESEFYGYTSPLDAIGTFLSKHSEWLVDVPLQNMFDVTQHLGGWLRRAS